MRPVARLLLTLGLGAALTAAGAVYWLYVHPRELALIAGQDVTGRGGVSDDAFAAVIHNKSDYRLKWLLIIVEIKPPEPERKKLIEQGYIPKFDGLDPGTLGPYRCDVDLLPNSVGQCRFPVDFFFHGARYSWSIIQVRGTNTLPWE